MHTTSTLNDDFSTGLPTTYKYNILSSYYGSSKLKDDIINRAVWTMFRWLCKMFPAVSLTRPRLEVWFPDIGVLPDLSTTSRKRSCRVEVSDQCRDWYPEHGRHGCGKGPFYRFRQIENTRKKEYSLKTSLDLIQRDDPGSCMSWKHVTQGITSSQQIDVTSTSTIETSLTETTVYTTVQPVTVKTTTTATATSHVAGPTLWCEMKIKTSGDGNSDGRYVYSQVPLNFIAPAGSSTQGTFQLDSGGVMHTFHTAYNTVVWTGFWGYSYVEPPQGLAINNFIPNKCQVDSITLEVFCQGNPTYNPSGYTGPWRWLAQDGTHLTLTHLTHGIYKYYSSDYQQIRLFAEPINCVS